MAKAQAKTTETKASVNDFIAAIADPARQRDAKAIVKLMKEVSGFPAKMWGSAIIGFGSYHYVYASGHEGDAPLVAFSPRKSEFALYLTSQLKNREARLKQLGKVKAAKACIYVKNLADVDLAVLRQLVAESVAYIQKTYPAKN